MATRAKRGTKAVDENIVEEVSVDFQKAMGKGYFVRFMSGSLGIRRKVDTEEIEGLRRNGDDEPGRQMISVTKKIIDCDEYREVQRVYGKIKALLSLRCIPVLSDMMKSCYLIHKSIFKPTYLEVKTLMAEHEAASEAFVKVYAKAQADAKKKLGKFYDEDDYPDVKQVREAFYRRVLIFGISVPGELKDEDENAEIFIAATQAMEQTYRESLDQARLVQRQIMHELLSNLKEKLTGSREGGKPKIFRDSAIEHVNDFIKFFKPKDITDDKMLGDLVTETKKFMEGVNAEQLRSDAEYRKEIAKQVSGVTTALDKMMITPATRAIRVKKGGYKE